MASTKVYKDTSLLPSYYLPSFLNRNLNLPTTATCLVPSPKNSFKKKIAPTKRLGGAKWDAQIYSFKVSGSRSVGVSVWPEFKKVLSKFRTIGVGGGGGGVIFFGFFSQLFSQTDGPREMPSKQTLPLAKISNNNWLSSTTFKTH